MAKMFYSAKEAAQKLGIAEAELKDLVRKGSLREFRDAGSVNYKVEEIDKFAETRGTPGGKAGSKAGSAAASASGAIVLEPAEESGINLASSGSDIFQMEEVVADDTATGMRATKKAKEGTVVPSVGINVFDDDELDEMVDPLAQTAVTDVGGLGIEGVGSGSGILDLTRESDDTSLGAELLEEIYTGEDAAPQMGEDTRAGLDVAVAEQVTPPTKDEEAFEVAEAAPGKPRAVVTRVVEYAPDAVSTGLTALMFAAALILWFAGLAAAGMARGFAPSLIQSLYANLAMYAGIATLLTAVAGVAAYFYAKRSS